MDKGKWSDYEKYLILADNSHGKNKIKDTYESFLNYKIVMDVINRIAFTDKSTYSYNNNIYSKKITSAEAQNMLTSLFNNRCNFKNYKKVALQIGIRV